MCSAAVSYFFYRVRSIVSKSNRPISYKFLGLVELYDSLKLVFQSLGQPVLCVLSTEIRRLCISVALSTELIRRRPVAQLGGLTLGFALHLVTCSISYLSS